MTSQRHNSDRTDGRSTARPSSAADGYLDAARACILDVGWRRTTLTEVARRAGVSRMTIYRTWPDMQQLMADLMTREWGELVAGIAGSDGSSSLMEHPSPDGIADAMVRAIRALRDNELFVRIVELDPELLLPYLLARRGRSQELVLQVLVTAIWKGQQEHAVRAGDAETIARGLLLSMHGFVLSAQTMVDDDVSLEALDEELLIAARKALAP